MKIHRFAFLFLCELLLATEPNAATRRWWSHVVALSNDGLQGRDTGSEGYRQAAKYVAAEFQKLGLKPAGESGYYQTVPLHAVRLQTNQSSVELVRKEGTQKLEWLKQITIPARLGLPETLEGEMVFAGTEQNLSGMDLHGKILVQLARARSRSAPAAGQGGASLPEGLAGIISIDPVGGPEPPRWPVAYSVAMTLASTPLPSGRAVPAFRFNPAESEVLFAGSGHSYKELAAIAAEGKPVPSFPLMGTFRARMHVETTDLQSDNVLATLPGADPQLASEYVVVSAHLDGYGVGEPWKGDRIYNGAFDDAAYVATLLDLAERLHDSGKKLKRSLLFVVVTGEEKGLLGSRYFTQHLTVPQGSMMANINLDQLRPIFPLTLLTTLAVNESTLGDTVKQVAAPMGIRIQEDPEPERNLLRRSDHYNFMQIGVPAVGFIFGYQKGSPEEVVYRRWYADRYHSPADDLNQPWDPAAAAKFNDFFDRVVETLADGAQRPQWKPGSSFAHAGGQ